MLTRPCCRPCGNSCQVFETCSCGSTDDLGFSYQCSPVPGATLAIYDHSGGTLLASGSYAVVANVNRISLCWDVDDPGVDDPGPGIRATVTVGSGTGGLAPGTYRLAYTFVNSRGETTIGAGESLPFTITAGDSLPDPTVRATVDLDFGSGGPPPGEYQVAYTFKNAGGETTIGAGESLPFTIASEDDVAVVALPDLPTGATGINLYIAWAESDGEVLIVEDIADSSYALNIPLPLLPGTHPPGSNTTSGSSLATAALPVRPTHASSINLYVTHAGGVSGSEVLYATGITSTTHALTESFPGTDSPVPAANTTRPTVYYVNDPQNARIVTATGTVAITPGATTGLSLSPAPGYQCIAGCGVPVAETLHATNSVLGTYTLTWNGFAWKGPLEVPLILHQSGVAYMGCFTGGSEVGATLEVSSCPPAFAARLHFPAIGDCPEVIWDLTE